MSGIKIIEWIGGDAPDRNAILKVSTTQGPRSMQFCAYWEPGYCGCPDCNPCVGWGATEKEAIADYWINWDDRRTLAVLARG